MARFLSPEWAEEFSAVLGGLVPPGAAPDADAPDGPVTVVQEVHGTPDGDVRLVLHIEDGALGLRLEPVSAETDQPGGPGGPGGTRPTVTVAVSYEDASAMSRGELTPAEALNAGRIRVRGDLSALVAAQHLLDGARSATRELVASTTY